jgi:hypothetical protein
VLHFSRSSMKNVTLCKWYAKATHDSHKSYFTHVTAAKDFNYCEKFGSCEQQISSLHCLENLFTHFFLLHPLFYLFSCCFILSFILPLQWFHFSLLAFGGKMFSLYLGKYKYKRREEKELSFHFTLISHSFHVQFYYLVLLLLHFFSMLIYKVLLLLFIFLFARSNKLHFRSFLTCNVNHVFVCTITEIN